MSKSLSSSAHQSFSPAKYEEKNLNIYINTYVEKKYIKIEDFFFSHFGPELKCTFIDNIRNKLFKQKNII
jgi:hypothetical protein